MTCHDMSWHPFCICLRQDTQSIGLFLTWPQSSDPTSDSSSGSGTSKFFVACHIMTDKELLNLCMYSTIFQYTLLPSTCVYIYTHINTYTFLHVYIYICMYTHTNTYTFTYKYIYIHMYTYMYVCIHKQYPQKLTWWGWGFRFCRHISGKHQTGLYKTKNIAFEQETHLLYIGTKNLVQIHP